MASRSRVSIFAVICCAIVCIILSGVGIHIWLKNEWIQKHVNIILTEYEQNILAEKTNYHLCKLSFFSIKCYDLKEKTKTSFAIEDKTGWKAYVQTSNPKKYELVQHSQVKYTKPKKIAILYMSTGRYIRFWNDFYAATEKHFLPRHHKTYFLFTDHDEIKVPENVRKIHQDQLPWPYITLKRYHFFTQIADQLKDFDYIYFMNGNLIVQQDINEEIFPTKEQGIMVTLHPGFYRRNKMDFPYDRNRRSMAFIPRGSGKYYVAGGLNGGRARDFLKLSRILMEKINLSLRNGAMPRWHDESILNRYVYEQQEKGQHPLVLLPTYLIPEGWQSLSEFEKYYKIIILDKSKLGGHKWLRG